jgi:hypothetical protein
MRKRGRSARKIMREQMGCRLIKLLEKIAGADLIEI